MNHTNGGRKERNNGGSPSYKAVRDPLAEVPVSALVLLGTGGMVLFMGSFFGLVALLGVGGFLVPALVISGLGALMMVVGWRIWRKNRHSHELSVQKEKERLLCDYCGGMNDEGDLQCRFCGAPLR